MSLRRRPFARHLAVAASTKHVSARSHACSIRPRSPEVVRHGVLGAQLHLLCRQGTPPTSSQVRRQSGLFQWTTSAARLSGWALAKWPAHLAGHNVLVQAGPIPLITSPSPNFACPKMEAAPRARMSPRRPPSLSSSGQATCNGAGRCRYESSYQPCWASAGDGACWSSRLKVNMETQMWYRTHKHDMCDATSCERNRSPRDCA